MAETALMVGAVGDSVAYEAAQRRQHDTRKVMARLVGIEVVRSMAASSALESAMVGAL